MWLVNRNAIKTLRNVTLRASYWRRRGVQFFHLNAEDWFGPRMDNHGLRPIDRLVCKTFIARETYTPYDDGGPKNTQSVFTRWVSCRAPLDVAYPPAVNTLFTHLMSDDLMIFLITLLKEDCSLASLISKAGEIWSWPSARATNSSSTTMKTITQDALWRTRRQIRRWIS